MGVQILCDPQFKFDRKLLAANLGNPPNMIIVAIKETVITAGFRGLTRSGRIGFGMMDIKNRYNLNNIDNIERKDKI